MNVVKGTEWERVLWPERFDTKAIREARERELNRIKAIGRAYKEGKYAKAMYDNPDLSDLIDDIGELFSRME